MAFCKIDNACAMALGEGLMRNMKLKYVNLSNNMIKDGGAIVIANALTIMKCQVQDLNLSFNQIEKKGGLAFAEMIRVNKHLIRCNLSYNSMGEKVGEEMVKSIIHNTKL
jgi:hypothetical protein